MRDLVGDRYELLDVIASGGMATVWRARDTRLGRMVAVKRPHPAAPDDPMHARIEREAVAAAALNHPNLVTLFDSGRDAVGPYLVMELLGGTPLGTGPQMSSDEIIAVGTALAGALAAVHGAGIVHRDVKPANVIMTERGPVLTDFGIASGPVAASSLTQPGTVVATASYAAPEVLAGETATPAADIFSLAAVLHELATGEPAFVGIDRSAPPAPLADAHLEAALRPALAFHPSHRPDAVGMERALRSSSPTGVLVTTGDATDTLPATDRPGGDRRSAAWPLLAIGSIVVAFLLVAASLLGAEPEPSTLPTQPAATNTTAPTASTMAPTTTPPTTLVPTTAPPAPDTARELDDARRRLASVLADVHPSDFNPKEVRDLLAKIDEAVTVSSDDGSKAAKTLEEAHRKIGDKLDDPWRSQAQTEVETIAALLGLTLDTPAEDEAGQDDDD